MSSFSIEDHIEISRRDLLFLEGLKQDFPDARRDRLPDGQYAYFVTSSEQAKPTCLEFFVSKDGRIHICSYFLYREGRVYVSPWVHAMDSMSPYTLMRLFQQRHPEAFAKLVECTLSEIG